MLEQHQNRVDWALGTEATSVENAEELEALLRWLRLGEVLWRR